MLFKKGFGWKHRHDHQQVTDETAKRIVIH
jgi:hypothetical protein